jgi:hypothetical protein
MPDPTLLVLEGVFHLPVEGLTVSTGTDEVRVDPALAPFKGKSVSLSVHHFPPTPVDPTLPGGGSCMWNGHCPCGHVEDPAWLYNLSLRGVLEGGESGIWSISGEGIPFSRHMPGHRGRLVVLADDGLATEGKGTDQLLSEAERLTDLLAGLRGALKT